MGLNLTVFYFELIISEMIRIGFTLLMIARLTQGWIWNYNGTWTEAFQSAMESSSSFLDNLATKIHQHPTVEAVCEQRFCQNGKLMASPNYGP